LRAAKAQGRILPAVEENRPPELMKNKVGNEGTRRPGGLNGNKARVREKPAGGRVLKHGPIGKQETQIASGNGSERGCALPTPFCTWTDRSW
jgi:hypothetical protein